MTTKKPAAPRIGRKPLAEGVQSVLVVARCTPQQRDKFRAIGGAKWFRNALDRAKLPEGGTT